ncbi:MAG: glycoside hydrolase family 88 protein [Oscillospiraceae bacterium]|nr:glycoside hydrolase family 88 protein [Oscillospiraceae bacterium]
MWLAYFKQFLNEIFPRFLAEKAWNYKDDLCVKGADDLARATGDESWRQPILDNATHLILQDGSIANWKPGEHNIDKVSFGKSLQILYGLTGDVRYANAVQQAFQTLNDYPRTVTGNFWHKDIYPNQVWLDGLYMGMPFYARCLAETGENRWDDIIDQFQNAHKLLWNENLGLYMHANDCSRKAEWADPISGQSPAVWLRAEGWFLMAMVDTWQIAKDHTARASELVPLLQNALDGILKYQVSETKMFLQVVDRADLPGNYSETSGSAMVAYSLMKGARLGILPEAYGERGSEILDAIRDRYLVKENDGYHLYGICASAGLGPGPDNRTDRDGTPAYYLSEKQMTDNQHGTAACMMAVSEQLLR